MMRTSESGRSEAWAPLHHGNYGVPFFQHQVYTMTPYDITAAARVASVESGCCYDKVLKCCGDLYWCPRRRIWIT
jgi:hypothetical protein